MAINQGLYGLLLQAIEDGRQQEADSVPVLNPALRDPNFRQLSRAPFVERLQNAEYPDVGAAASADRSGMNAGLPWTFNRSPMTPMPASFRGALVRRGPMPPPSATGPEYTPQHGYTPQRAISDAFNRWGFLFGFMHELQRKRIMGDLDDGQDTAAGPILELYQNRRRDERSKPGSRKEEPVTIENAPGIVPDAHADADADADADVSVATEGGNKANPCLDRWEGEYNSCDRFWLPKTSRWKEACQARANDRLSLCYRNGRTPDSAEPPEYSWKEVPKDPAGRRPKR
jgi:hypothetical protein